MANNLDIEIINPRPLVVEELKPSMLVFDMYENEWYKIQGLISTTLWLWTPDGVHAVTPYKMDEFKKIFTQMAD